MKLSLYILILGLFFVFYLLAGIQRSFSQILQNFFIFIPWIHFFWLMSFAFQVASLPILSLFLLCF